MKKILNVMVMLCLVLLLTDAHATPFNFSFQDIQAPIDISSNFQGLVDLDGSNIVFTIANNGPVASFIRQIYFEYTPDNLLTNGSFVGGTGVVKFVTLANDNFPQGNVISFDSDFQEVADNPGPTYGVNVGETASFSFSSTYTFDNIVTAMNNNDLRIGIHVQGIPISPGSDSYVSSVSSVPEPTTLLLLGLGLVGMAGLRRKLR